jgi:excisionase family DNA binding protein
MARHYTTKQVADAVGVNKRTLLRWLQDGKVPEPRRIRNGGLDARIWTARDVERVRKWKAAHYRKGRGRKKR